MLYERVRRLHVCDLVIDATIYDKIELITNWEAIERSSEDLGQNASLIRLILFQSRSLTALQNACQKNVYYHLQWILQKRMELVVQEIYNSTRGSSSLL